MGVVYYANFRGQTITNAGGDRDFFYLAPADDKPLKILALIFSPAAPGDLGDAQEETLSYAIIKGHATVGSGGTLVTNSAVYRHLSQLPDPGAVIRTNDTTIASAGTPLSAVEDAFNIRIGAQIWFPEKLQIQATQGDSSIVVRLLTAPADDITMSATIIFEEGA